MNTIIRCIILLMLFSVHAVHALPSSERTATPAPRNPHAKKVDESDKPPFVGMTKAQAIYRYGKPNRKTSSEEGEQWTYILNLGQFIGKHMIPFFVSTQALRVGVLTFGPDERVKKFRWDVPED